MLLLTRVPFFPKDSYLGVLRLFLWVLEVARIRRLGSVGEVSAPAEELCGPDFLQIWVVPPAAREEFPRTSGSDCIYAEIADARGSDFIYTEIADARRSDFIYTEMRRAGGNEFIDLGYWFYLE